MTRTPDAAGRSWRKYDRRPAEALEEAGFLDIGAHAEDATPTVRHDSNLSYRCDRVYTTLPASTITGSQVITRTDSDSDHRPVIAEFDLTRTTARDVRAGDQS